ncbi:HNH endonuclease signature motif containing protein [Paraglaciecola chathamensis]|uniref:HNH endonuclease n=1 Tax=Paraglaciecola chathamensis TaxID=368405 RepID=UPI0026F74AD0|nr:HNH endonuclease signature motif containing protein [Paraglaciecola chathamensis]MDO6841235.1 HNH endonuclease signature motif containing protein [Paraglaciecola chathamensis]
MIRKSFSWEVISETCAIKTIDATVIRESSTGIPQDIVPFFLGKLLNEGEERWLEFVAEGENAKCKISKNQNRHRLFLGELKGALAKFQLEKGGQLFFDKHPVKPNCFIVSGIINETNEIIQPDFPLGNVVGENRSTNSSYRVGHGLFSERVRRRFNYTCCATGANELTPRVLIASHIKPWVKSTGIEKLDPFNGLLLAPHIDRLFDKGHMSFSERGIPLLADSVAGNIDELWDLKNCKLNSIAAEAQDYLAFHRKLYNFS